MAGAIAIGGGLAGATVVPAWFTAPPTMGVPPVAGAALDMPDEERAAAALVARSLVSQAASASAAAAAVPTIFQTIIVPPRLKRRAIPAAEGRGRTALQEPNALFKA